MDEFDCGLVACLVALWRFPLVRSARRAYPPLVSKEPLHSTGFEPDNAKVRAVREALMAWFDENGRELPWRRTRDPWRILVSEVMLQQIQVKRAIPFYEAFVERFATPRALAEEPLAEAIRAWGDLGRYRRGGYLQRAAPTLPQGVDGGGP